MIEDGETCVECGGPTNDVGWLTDEGYICEDCGPPRE